MRFNTIAFVCVYLLIGAESFANDDWITGYNSFIFRSSRDQIFSGSAIRRDENRERYTALNYLTIQKLKIHEEDDYRIWGTGSVWYRHDFGDTLFSSRDKAEINFAAIQIDPGRTTDGFFKAGRIYNYRGLLNQRFDGAELYLPFDNGIELDIYGGRRVNSFVEDIDDPWLGGGRVGYITNRRSTVGFSWLLSRTEGQWEHQKIGGDWSLQPMRWLDINGNWGYDLTAEEFYEIQSHVRASVSRDFDVRFVYDNVIPGLLIPKTSVFSVFSLAEEERLSTQLAWRPSRKWELITDFTYVDFSNDGGFGNFGSDLNRVDGGYQWRYGFEVVYRHNLFDELSFRFEQMVEGDFGYTITDLIRTDFDFTNFDLNNPPPDAEGLVFGELENGFSSISLSHWHEWSRKFSHSMNFYYYNYDNPLFLHEQGDDSYSFNFTCTYKPSRTWDFSLGGRYLSSLADNESIQAYIRIVNRF